MRGSTAFLAMAAAGIASAALVLADSSARVRRAGDALAPCRSAVSEFRLTDLCLFTEARYARNPALSDVHSAFQDHPTALEHFPSGSFVPPPPADRR